MQRFPESFIASTVFALTILTSQLPQAQTYKVLYRFTDGQDGSQPFAGLTMDKAGRLYGTAYAGGSAHNCAPYSGCGTVFRLTPRGSGWIFAPLYSFQGGNDGGNPDSRSVIGPNGILYGTTNLGGGGCLGAGCGTVYGLRPPPRASANILGGWTESFLYPFWNISEGAYPSPGDLVFDSLGNIYGTTVEGGLYGNGTVYELTFSNGNWTESALYSFSGPTDGQNPVTGVIFDALGNLYGTTGWGGLYGCGTVFQLIPSETGWIEQTLHEFNPTAGDGCEPRGSLVVPDNSGNLYGSTVGGGSLGGGTVFMLDSSNGWAETLIYGFPGATGYGPTGNIAIDATGNIFGATLGNGAYGQGFVFRLSHSDGGWTLADLYDFSDSEDGKDPAGGVILDANGNLYGTTVGGGDLQDCSAGCGVVWEITP